MHLIESYFLLHAYMSIIHKTNTTMLWQNLSNLLSCKRFRSANSMKAPRNKLKGLSVNVNIFRNVSNSSREDHLCVMFSGLIPCLLIVRPFLLNFRLVQFCSPFLLLFFYSCNSLNKESVYYSFLMENWANPCTYSIWNTVFVSKPDIKKRWTKMSRQQEKIM